MEKLTQISTRAPKKLGGLQFGELFEWLSASLSVVSQSVPGEQVGMEKTGWEEL
jgi:uncharacterized protein YegL